MAGIDSDLIRGHIDTIILKSLYHGDKYGLEIIQEIEEKSNGSYELKQPTLYSCLKRLESQGLISSYWEDSEIGGKRHYYKLTDQGKEAYKRNQEEWLKSREIIDNLIYNTTMDYAPIYDNDAEVQTEVPVIDQQEETQDEVSSPAPAIDDCFAEEEVDEFASFDTIETTAHGTFFESNNETASDDEFETESSEPVITPIVSDEQTEEDEESSEVVSLSFDEDDNDEYVEEINNAIIKETEYIEEIVSENENSNDLLFIEDSDGEEPSDDEIYNPEPEVDFDDQIYNPYQDESEEEETAEEEPQQEEIITPTYINFDSHNYDEVDITSLDENEENQEQPEFEDLLIEPDDDVVEDNQEPETPYVPQEIPRASQEEIENLYRTTENYENLQVGYTDETYKQMLNELESYGNTQPTTETVSERKTLTLSELTEQFEAEGIVVRKYEKQVKESNDSKIYIKTNQIHLIKNWITFGFISLALLLTFVIMNSFKDSLTYDFKFAWFAIAFGVAIIIPVISSIKYALNPYKKVVAKYAPRLSILLSFLITIQLILIIYCVNLQLGFYSFTQENYNHLLWILPLVLSFIPIVQAIVYLPLYSSKNYHI